MIEEWRPVDFTKGKYLVSNLGQVKGPSGRILKHRMTPDGYHDVSMMVNSKTIYRKVHRLVAEAFLPDFAPYPEKEVNHKDGNKDNNAVDNLEMTTHQGNMTHYWKSDVFAEQQKKYSKYAEQAMTARWQNPEFRNKVQGVFDSPEYKASHSEACKKIYDNPEQRKRAGEQSKQRWADPEYHVKQVEAIKNGWSDESKRAEVSKRISRLVWMTRPDGTYYRCPPDEVEDKIAKGYVRGRR